MGGLVFWKAISGMCLGRNANGTGMEPKKQEAEMWNRRANRGSDATANCNISKKEPAFVVRGRAIEV
jgi:hypothetical protein